MDTNVIDLATHCDQHHWLGQALWRTRLARTSTMMNTIHRFGQALRRTRLARTRPMHTMNGADKQL